MKWNGNIDSYNPLAIAARDAEAAYERDYQNSRPARERRQREQGPPGINEMVELYAEDPEAFDREWARRERGTR